MDCKERILSEDYLDLLADYDVMLKYRDVESADFCYLKIDDELYVAYSSKKDVPGYDISLVKYESIPKCFGLMSDMEQTQAGIERADFNYNPLIQSGIIETNNPPLALTGQGVIVAFIDTGERVIIMSS